MTPSETATTPFALRAPRDEPLARSPLKIVVANLRFTPTPAAANLDVGVQLQERLGGRDAWRMDPIRTQTLTLGSAGVFPSAPTVELQTTGWRLESKDDAWTVTLSPEGAGVETTAYTTWDHFRRTMGLLLDCLNDMVHPSAELRLGLRYVNRIDDPRVTSPAEWQRWIAPSVLGIIQEPIGRAVVAAQQQLNLALSNGLRATIGHGFFKDPSTNQLTYLMDFDTYREGTRPFARDELRGSGEDLHTICLQLFQNMITDELYEYLMRPAL